MTRVFRRPPPLAAIPQTSFPSKIRAEASPTTLAPQSAARWSHLAPDVEPAPRVVRLPEGWPPTFDLGAAAAGISELLALQAKPPLGRAAAVVFTDMDLTLFEAPALPTYLVHAKTQQLLMDPATERPVILGMGADRDPKADLKRLSEKRPELDLSQFRLDSREFDSVANVLAAKPIPETVEFLKQANGSEATRQFVITARGGNDGVRDTLHRYLEERDIKADGVFMMYHPEHASKLGLNVGFGQGQRKALTMAAILHRADPALASIRRVRFIDDNDENLRAAMELLPKLFPSIKFEFIDVIHDGHGKYRHELVAKSSREGKLTGSKGDVLSDDSIRNYRSKDAPFSPAPAPIGFWKENEAFGELSNFAQFPIELDGKTWPTTEHYFQAQKFIGTPHEEEIRNAKSPKLAAAMGRDRERPLRKDWDSVKESVMERAIEAKFTQHADLRTLLVATGDALLRETSQTDAYWGTGADGKGQNRLGELLMRLRARISAE